MNSIIITTTNNIEGYNITKYYSPISANVVTGANIFSDISASLTDFFGGNSGTYEKKLQEMYVEVVDKLKIRAEDVGANSIVGLKVDFGEISGKGNQMFMLSAVGTPTVADRDISNKGATNDNTQIIDGTLVETKIKANKIIQDFEKDRRLNDNKIEFILKSRLLDFSNLVVSIIKNINLSTEQDELISRLSLYFRVIDKKDAINIIYRTLSSEGLETKAAHHLISIIGKFDLIDYDHVNELLKADDKEIKKYAINIIALPKTAYLNSDINHLMEFKQIILDSFPKIAESVKTKGFLSSEKEAWRCICGKTNEINIMYCYSCEKDQFGFRSNEIKPNTIINLIENRLEMIEELQIQDTKKAL